MATGKDNYEDFYTSSELIKAMYNAIKDGTFGGKMREETLNNRAYISDLSYYIEKKEQFLEKIDNEKSKISIEREIDFLKLIRTILKRTGEKLVEAYSDIDFILKYKTLNKHNYKISQALECAFKYYSLTGEKANVLHVLTMIANNPDYYIQKFADQIIWWKQGEKELNEIMKNFTCYEQKYREVFIAICKTYGFDENKKLAVWKRKTDNRNKQK